jgi:hypothetical protein
MRISEIPDRWTIIRIDNNGNIIHKVFASWSGGYLDGDSWKLNSGITKVDSDEDNYYFYGVSGSCYKCSRTRYGIATAYSLGILNNIIDRVGIVEGVSVSVLEDSENWMDLL